MADIKTVSGSIVRTQLAVFGGYLIAKGADSEVVNQAINANAELVSGIIAALFVQGWSLFHKWTGVED